MNGQSIEDPKVAAALAANFPMVYQTLLAIKRAQYEQRALKQRWDEYMAMEPNDYIVAMQCNLAALVDAKLIEIDALQDEILQHFSVVDINAVKTEDVNTIVDQVGKTDEQIYQSVLNKFNLAFARRKCHGDVGDTMKAQLTNHEYAAYCRRANVNTEIRAHFKKKSIDKAAADSKAVRRS